MVLRDMSKLWREFGELTLFTFLLLSCGSEDQENLYEVVSDNGGFVLELIPKASINLVGLNRYELILSDEQAIAVEQAQITIIPWMPDHGHGTDREPSIVPMGDGVYAVEDVVYTMPGLWHLNVDIITASMTDKARFELEVH